MTPICLVKHFKPVYQLVRKTPGPVLFKQGGIIKVEQIYDALYIGFKFGGFDF